MTNALATLTQVAQTSEVDEIFQTGVGYEDSFKFVPMQITVAPGGVQAFASADGEMISAPLVGIVIGAVITRGLWREGNKVPLCASIGGDLGEVNRGATAEDWAALAMFPAAHPVLSLLANGNTPHSFRCRGCPMDDFGSALKGTGKACKEKRRLLVLPDGWSAPAILNLPTMSVKGWDVYCSTLRTKHSKPFFAVRTSFGIAKVQNAQGQPYGQVTPGLAGFITDRSIAAAIVEVQRQFADILRTLPVEDDAYGDQTGDDNGHGEDEPF